MQDLNINILKKNVCSLMKRDGLTQAALAEKLQMSQPNLSKAINPNEKKIFTVEQLYKLSQIFGVSIDDLLGIDMRNISSRKEVEVKKIAQMLIPIFEKGLASFIPVTINEPVYEPTAEEPNGPYHLTYHDVKYQALVFHSYINPDEYPLFRPFNPFSFYFRSENKLTLEDVCTINGNESKYCDLNKFFENYSEILDLTMRKKISIDNYETIIKGYLDNLDFPI